MKSWQRSVLRLLVAMTVSSWAPFAAAQSQADANDDSLTRLEGLWQSYRAFGPAVHGQLILEERDGRWHGQIAGFTVEATVEGDEFTFSLPGDAGSFAGSFDASGRPSGHWIQPPPQQVGRAMASPVRFQKSGPSLWRGEVTPRPNEFTFFLKVQEREDGTMGVFLRNPDRNQGIYYNLDRIEGDLDDLRFVGQWFRNPQERVLLRGDFQPDFDLLRVFIPWRGGTYDFRRVAEEGVSAFYARGAAPKPWSYRSPPQLDDGWETTTLEEVGIDPAPLARMIEQEIDPVAQDVHAHYVHAILIARHGKLVFEEYFHGFHREVPHDSRSASKSLTSMLTGAAMEAGYSVDPSMPVYETIYGDEMPGDLDPRKQRMTLEHLLTTSSGFHCDDGDGQAPGNEDRMQEQEEQPNWYQYTLDLPMVSEPGEKAVYCSVNSNLAGAVLQAATGKPLAALFEQLIAEPLDVQRYHLFLQPTGEPYMGGGIHWMPRDFAKLGQVLLNGGTWNGRRILSQEYADRSVSSLYRLGNRDYGYLWWSIDYPYGDGTVRAFFAGGNGGQVVIGVPELDLLITFLGGNYSDRVLFRSQDVLVPEYILPAVDASASR